jgi:hypothetical protein
MQTGRSTLCSSKICQVFVQNLTLHSKNPPASNLFHWCYLRTKNMYSCILTEVGLSLMYIHMFIRTQSFKVPMYIHICGDSYNSTMVFYEVGFKLPTRVRTNFFCSKLTSVALQTIFFRLLRLEVEQTPLSRYISVDLELKSLF